MGEDRDNVKDILASILCQKLEDTSFFASLFWPNNAWLHPPILYGLFKDWDGKKYYNSTHLPKLLYADLSKDSQDIVIQLDAEICGLVKKLSSFYPSDKFLALDYGLQHNIIINYQDDVSDQSTLPSSISTCKAFG